MSGCLILSHVSVSLILVYVHCVVIQVGRLNINQPYHHQEQIEIHKRFHQLLIARLHFPVSGISISWSLFFVPVQDSSGFLWILVFSGGIFLREPPFGWTPESRITPESPEYSGIPVPVKKINVI